MSTVELRPLMLLLLAAGLGAGCSTSTSSTLLMKPNKGGAFSQKFERAYATRNVDGIVELVLVADDAKPRQTKSGDAIKPAASEPLRQVVYVKVLWLPM